VTWKRALTLALVAVALWYLGGTVAANWDELRRHQWTVDPALLALSVGLHVGVLAWGVWVWRLVLARFEGDPVRYSLLYRMWSLSNLARYAPGKIWQFIAVAQLARERGLPPALMLTSVMVHTGFSLLAALAVGSLVVPAGTLGGLPRWGLSGLAVVVAALSVHPRVLNLAIGVLPRLMRRPVAAWTGSWWDGVTLLLCSVGAWLLYGVAYHVFVRSISPIPWEALPLLTGVNAWSFVIGYAAFFSIAGLGARELAMSTLLLPVMPAGVAALVAVAARLWTVLAEIAGGLLSLLVGRGARPAVRGPAAHAAPAPDEDGGVAPR
jgi:glycosyltransferase 2 family protein